MAGVISISSDEEEPTNCIENPKKICKVASVISLLGDDNEDKEIKSRSEIEDIIIESDEDALCFDKNVTKVLSTNDYLNGKDLHNENFNGQNAKDLSDESIKCKQTENIKHGKKKAKIIINNEDVEPLAESDEDSEFITKSNITLGGISKNNNSDNIAKNCGASTSQQVHIETFKTCEKMQLLISVCLSQITNENTKDLFKSKVPFCEKLFNKVNTAYIQSENFKGFLDEKITNSKESSLKAVSSFNDVYYHLKSKIRQEKTGIELTDKHQVLVAKLEHALRKVRKKISKLEEEEVDFDEEYDSSYIKMQRYRERAVNLHKKICKYKKEDANTHNILYSRLDFVGSKYPEINHAINKKFKNNSVFPSYYEVEKCIKKVVKDKNMNLTDIRLKQEARECFKNLGGLLQKRRKMDLLNVHSHYLVTNDDPAYQDKELDSKLTTNLEQANTKIDEICQKYVKLQEGGENPELSSDSDDSKRVSSEDEDDCE